MKKIISLVCCLAIALGTVFAIPGVIKVSAAGSNSQKITRGEAIELGAKITTIANGKGYATKEVTFDTPVDASNSEGYIVIKESASKAGRYSFKLKIFTSNKTSYEYSRGFTMYENGTREIKVMLTSLGLKDADLKSVLGYTFSVAGKDEAADYYFSITAPGTTNVESVIGSGTLRGSKGWGQDWLVSSVDYDTPVDLSTSDGMLYLSYSATDAHPDSGSTGVYSKVTIRTANKSATWDLGYQPYTEANVTKNYSVAFADMGLSLEDLRCVTGYAYEGTVNANPCYLTYFLKSPSLAPKFVAEDYVTLPYDSVDGKLYMDAIKSVAEFKSNYYDVQVYNPDGTVANSGLLKTGMIAANTCKGTLVESAEIVVNNDINSDGLSNSADIITLQKYLVGAQPLSNTQLSALEIQKTEEISLLNLIKMKKTLAGVVKLGQVSKGQWKQQEFYLSSGGHPTNLEGFRNYKEAGYNMAEFTNCNNENIHEALSNCEAVGGIAAVPANFTRYTFNNGNLKYSDWSIRRVVNEYDKYSCVVGYSVYDEPIAGENNSNFTNAANVKNLLDKYDPNSLKYVNMLPSYGVYNWSSSDYNWNGGSYEGYVNTFIELYKPQVISVDYYPYLMGHQGNRSDWWRDMGFYRKKSLEHNIPFWYYYQGMNIVNGYHEPTNAEIKYQMYVGLAYGAKQLSQWTCAGDGLNADGTKTALFETTKARNKELMAVGRYLFDKTTTKIHHTDIGYFGSSDLNKFYLDSIYSSDLFDYSLLSSPPSDIIISVFEDGKTSNKYVLFVNRNTTSTKTETIKLKSSKSISKFNKTTGAEDYINSSKSVSVSIPAGSGEIYILK